MKNNKKNGIIVLVIIMVVVVLTIVSSFLGQGKDSEQKNRRNPDFRYIMEKKPKDNYIAALYINGVIEAANMEYNQEWLLDTIKTLKNDGNNMALAIFIDSPGGSVYEADEAYLALQDIRKKNIRLPRKPCSVRRILHFMRGGQNLCKQEHAHRLNRSNHGKFL